MKTQSFLVPVALALVSAVAAQAAEPAAHLSLESPAFRLDWAQEPGGWRLTHATISTPSGPRALGTPSGEYCVLHSTEDPPADPLDVPTPNNPDGFPEASYRNATIRWKEARSPVAMNVAGQAHPFLPAHAERQPDGSLLFRHESEVGTLTAEWRLDPAASTDVLVTLTLRAAKPGCFSVATPTLATVEPRDLAWALVPGVFAGSAIEPDFVRALGYGQGLPAKPVLARERTASTLAAITENRHGATLAAIAEPGTAADPWEHDADSRRIWRLGLSHMNRRGELTGTLYHPVLGQAGSRLAAGESVSFRFRYTLRSDGWTGVLRHAAYHVYRLEDFLALKQPARSLSDRLQGMRRYVSDDTTSLWRTVDFNGRTLGAQAYLGIVIGSDRSDRDAIKNSDYGAMWMLAGMTGDPKLTRDRLPPARAFKLEQQETKPGFFQGAAIGQYFLMKSGRFTEEFGSYVEPVALTYYSLCDLGNILLFAPDDAELRARLRLGADRLLAWQHPDGRWDVAYDRATQRPVYADLRDFRPTFYGLLIAHRILGDEQYLAAARRGADWLLAHAVAPLRFTGVCGDNRFPPDFATAQIAAALLELHAATGDPRYRDAGLAAARFYLTSIYTHPVANTRAKLVKGAPRSDWEINQTGLCFEHGGTFGSANGGGPILLLSHAGFFLRLHRLTGEPLFRDLARAGAWARDAFVDPQTSVASYYWTRMNDGPGRFPHHAWWQIGWIVDYLLAEAELRTAGAIAFPRGFFTPKVGPHASFGFAPGAIFGESAHLDWGDVETGSPAVDYVLARAPDGRKRFVLLLNNSAHPVTAQVRVSGTTSPEGAARAAMRRSLRTADERVEHAPGEADSPVRVPLAAAGWALLTLEFTP
jgi:hypothetical protein